MLSKNAMFFMESIASMYRKTGKTEFDNSDYMSIPNHNDAIEELTEAGYLTRKVNILGTVILNLESIK